MERHLRARRPLVRAIAGAGCAVIAAGGLLVAGTGAASAAPKKQLSALQQGLNFYRGKTITFISPDSPGGGYDTWATILAPYLGAAIGAAHVNIENIPAGNTIAGQNAVASSSGDGLTIGWMNVGGDVENLIEHLPALSFNPEREVMIGGTAPNVSVLVDSTRSSCSAYTSLKSLITNSATNRVSELTQTSGVTDLYLRLGNLAFGIHANVITGYISTAALVQGFLRGDGCVANITLSQSGALIKNGQAVALAVTTPVPKANGYYSYFHSTPTYSSIASHLESVVRNPTKLQKDGLRALVDISESDTRILFAPTTVASYKVTALRWAMQKAMTNPALVAQTVAAGNTAGFIPGAAAKQLFINAYNAGKPVGTDLG